MDRKYTIPICIRGEVIGSADVEHHDDGSFTLVGRVEEKYRELALKQGEFWFTAALPRVTNLKEFNAQE